MLAFDADDTLWVNEPLYTEAQDRLTRLLRPYVFQSGETLPGCVQIWGQNLTPQPPSLQGKGESGSPPRFGEGPGERFAPNLNTPQFADSPR